MSNTSPGEAAGAGLPGAPGPAHILVAEDDVASSMVLRTLLGYDGYQVTAVEDGSSALRMLEENGPPDLLLLDWMLPGLTGLEICQEARQRWDTLALPILMVTARTDADSIAAAFAAGASDYIAKPYLGVELRARVAAHLRTKRLVEERRRMEEHLREREKLSALGLLASGVAHDLNNPLSSIAGYAQLLLSGEADPHKSEDLRLILNEAERCRRLIGNLLGFARHYPAEREEAELEPLLRSTFDLRERHLRTSGIHASLTVAEGLPPLAAVGHQLQQVFLNILLNAEHALRHRGGTLRITAERAALTSGAPEAKAPAGGDDDAVSAQSADPAGGEGARDGVRIDFFNDGPPIPAEVLPHIFDPFFTTKARDEGTGLGLSICHGIVREHGGEITVESGEQGTTFRVLLPITEPGAA